MHQPMVLLIIYLLIMIGYNYSSLIKVATEKETLDIIRLARSENISTSLFYQLINFFGNAQNALENIEEFSIKGGRSKPIEICTLEKVNLELNGLRKYGGDVLTYQDSSYSKLLLNIYDPPPVISYVGNKELLNKNILAIVGARNASANGIGFAKKLAHDLKNLNFILASGLARGIDTAVHESSLPGTIAVIAGGIGNIYPPENKKLYEQIEAEGLIIAELAYNVAPLAQHFPQRNRIISGISSATLVIEAGLQSGSLHTARFALEQGREVFATPGFPLDPRSKGTNLLIKEGATVLEDAQDVINNLPRIELYKNRFSDKGDATFIVGQNINTSFITDEDRKFVINLLSATPIEIDFLMQYTKLPISIIYVILLELELANKIIRSPDNKIALLYK